MNTIKEILEKKSNSYKRYIEEICSECSNKDNKDDLCNITRTVDGTVKCINYARCMTTKCKTCEKESECFKKGE